MIAFVRGARVLTLPLMLVVAGIAVDAQVPISPLVTVKVSRETVPPGAIAQMKVLITEPKPITTGRMAFDAFTVIEGIALAPGDSAGVAVVRGSQIALSVLSPTGTFATNSDYPILTVAGRVPATTPLGMNIPITIDPGALQLVDPGGTLYPVEVKNGYLLIGGSLSISDVVPGSADVDAGGVVSIFGSGFRPDTKIKLKGTLLDDVRYISPSRIDVVLATLAHMHRREIRAENPDRSQVTYFSYQRTHRSGTTTHPALQDVVPIFPDSSSHRYLIDISDATAGIALQNRNDTDTFVFAELRDASGLPLATGSIEVPSNTYVVRSISEIFDRSLPGSGVVTLVGVTPVQALGVDVDRVGRATPRLPR